MLYLSLINELNIIINSLLFFLSVYLLLIILVAKLVQTPRADPTT